jgi:hypothetical protein
MGMRLSIFRRAGRKLHSCQSDRVDFVTVVNVGGSDLHGDDAPAVLLVGHIFGGDPSLTPLDFTTLQGVKGARPGPNMAGSDNPDWIDELKRASKGKCTARYFRINDGGAR